MEKHQEKDNYEIAKIRTREYFLGYDMDRMQKKFDLPGDEEAFYLNFLNRSYRVGKKDGVVAWQTDSGEWKEGIFGDTMTIYDVLGDSSDNCHLSGEFCAVNQLKGVVQTGSQGVGESLHQRYAQRMDHHLPELAKACEALGGHPETELKVRADLAYRIPLFDFLPVILQFWESDDEFPPSLTLLFDRNLQDYMKYETSWYAAGFMLDLLMKEMEE